MISVTTKVILTTEEVITATFKFIAATIYKGDPGHYQTYVSH